MMTANDHAIGLRLFLPAIPGEGTRAAIVRAA